MPRWQSRDASTTPSPEGLEAGRARKDTPPFFEAGMTRFYVVFTNHPSGDHLRINAKQYRRNANSKKQGESAHPILSKLT